MSTITAPYRDLRRASLPGQGSLARWVSAHSQGGGVDGSVLFHAPCTAFQAPGGGENQLVQTGRALEESGVDVRLFSPYRDRLSDARLLHLFGMSREGLELARAAKRQNVPIALSTICWFEPRALLSLAPNRLRGAVDMAKWSLKGMIPSLPSWRGELLALADVVLPNSRAEADSLARLFGVTREKIEVVPNGVDLRFADADPDLYQRVYGRGPFVLYVGRIEPRKNVLALARAARSAGLPLVVIGGTPAGHEAYEAECRKAAGPEARFLPAMPHDDPMLTSAYAASRVFALPSWFETPGLAALEAALAGSAVVITPNGCTREYFADQVHYASPHRPDQIARALGDAWSEGPRPGLAGRLQKEFPWTEVARRTAEAYDHISQ